MKELSCAELGGSDCNFVAKGETVDEVKNAIDKLGCASFEKPFQLSEISDWINDCEKSIDLSLPLGSL